VGRIQEINDLKRLLAETRLLSLTGVGGSGKTRLATEVARKMLEEFADGIRDGIWFVDLSATVERNQIARTTAAALGIREQGRGSLTEIIISHLQTKHSLIILDNCEQIIQPIASFAEEILHGCPNLKVLTTSRQAMGIAGEVVFEVPPMALPDESEDVENLLGADAIRLFEERARSSQPGYAIEDQDAQHVLDICRGVDAIPLAIELAAARMKMLTPAQIAERMRDRFGLLSRGSRTADPRQQTLWAMIDWSFNLLDERGQRLLPRLSVFRGGFTLEAVEAICSGNGIDQNEMLDILTDLVEKSLGIVAERTIDIVRYGLLETVRHYGEQRLREAGELELWKRAHLGFFEDLSRELKPELLGSNQQMAMKRLNGERANLHAAIQWALKTSELCRTSGLCLVEALGKYWEMEGLWSEGRAQLEAVLRLSDGGGVPELRARALIWAGFLAYRQGDYEIAQTHLEESVQVSQSAGDVREQSYALSNLGSVAWAKGEVDAAKRYYGEGLKLAKEIENLFGMAMSLHNLALVHHESGDLQTAHKLYEESLALKREIGSPDNVALTLNNLGNLAQLRGDIDRAMEYHQECLEIRREVGDQGTISFSLANLGNAHYILEEYDLARRYYEESLELRRKIGDQVGIAWLLNSLGNISRVQDDLDASKQLYEEALLLQQELGEMRGVAATLNNLGATESMLQNHNRALELLRECIQLRYQLEDHQMLAGSFINIASCLVSQEQYADAAQCLGCAQEILQTTDGEMEPESARSFARDSDAIKEALGDERFAELFAKGRSSSIEAVIEIVMS